MKIILENFRSFKNKTTFNLKKLNILIGKNNSGKSTFARIFPLLKQTFLAKLSEPILWYGDDVDFGNFSISKGLFKGSNKKTIRLGIEFENKNEALFSNLSANLWILDEYIEKIQIKSQFFDFEIKMSYDNETSNKENKRVNSLKMGNEEMILGEKNFDCYWLKREDEIIPYIDFESFSPMFSNKKSSSEIKKLFLGSIKKSNKNVVFKDELLIRNINWIIHDFFRIFNKSTSKDWVELLINRICKMLHIDESDSCDIKKSEMLNKYIIFQSLNEIISLVNYKIQMIFKSVIYIKPIRAHIERNYRLQGLHTDSINSDGNNLAMILLKDKNFNGDDNLSFSKWCKEKMNLEIFTKVENNYVSLYIKEKNGNDINLVDSGYGFSQLLPILWVIWKFNEKMISSNNDFIRKNHMRVFGLDNQELILVIEQPELHLHPALQSKFTNLIANIVKESMEKIKTNIHIIIETHSETIINELGNSVIKTNSLKNEINLILFHKNTDFTTVETVNYNEKGIIQKWPLGFFD